MEVGVRVIRGPDWRWGQQDGGEGHTGTVAEVLGGQGGGPPDSVVVQWDCGGRCKYRCGEEDKYDLRIVDTAPTGRTHLRKTCTWCDVHPILGVVWMCAYCYDYCLCTDCYMLSKHSLDHPFDRCMTRDYKKRVRVPPRFLAEKVPLMGMYPEAVVVRGCDWQWRNQDGRRGNRGRVIKIQGWKDETSRSVAIVKWDGAHTNNVYRRGHHGKMDLECLTASSGGSCFIDHLPLLGYKYPEDLDVGVTAGDSVAVFVDPDLFKAAQEGHGGWSDCLAEHIGRTGVVMEVIPHAGSVIVRYFNGRVVELNEEVITKMDIPLFWHRDIVRVIDDMVQVYSLQKGHGEWADDMALSLGQVGKVITTNDNEDTVVTVNGRRWVFNPKCLVLTPEDAHLIEEEEESRAIGDLTRLKVLKLVNAGNPAAVPAAVVAGDIETLRKFLEKNPQEVNYKQDGKSPLNLAVAHSHIAILKLLIEFNADLNMQDGLKGDTPLHTAARMNDSTAARVLLEAGADVNAGDHNANSAILIASVLGHARVLETLCSTQGANLNSEGIDGDAPLHKAMFSRSRATVRALLKYGGDPLKTDFASLSALHEGAKRGHFAGVEEVLRYYPQHINAKHTNQYTLLHIATVINRPDLVTLLASHPDCDINIRDQQGCTALHLGIVRGYIAPIERLVGFGADMTPFAITGNNVLHEVLSASDMGAPSNDTPQIKKIQDEVIAEHGEGVLSANMIVALFLIANGADIHTKNELGQSFISMCPSDSNSLLNKYSERKDPFYGSLKGLANPFTDPPKSIKEQRPPLDRARNAPAPSRPVPISTTTRSHTDTQAAPLPTTRSPFTYQRSRSTTAATTPPSPFNPHNVPSPSPTNSPNVPSPFPATPPSAAVPPESRRGRSEVVEAIDQVISAVQHVQISPPTEKADVKVSRCLLCEAGADIRLTPCGHVSLCHECAADVKGVKRCLQCRKPVTEWKAVCILCHSEEISRTLDPCGHTYCSGCGKGLDYCTACRSLASEP